MDIKGKKVVLHDMSLRDGMHPKQHQITVEEMVNIATGLDDANVPLIEVTHGDGLGGASINYGFPAATDKEFLYRCLNAVRRGPDRRWVRDVSRARTRDAWRPEVQGRLLAFPLCES